MKKIFFDILGERKVSLLIFAFALCTNIVAAQNADIPRPEHPRPQFERSEWINLNGTWTYQFDFGMSGMEQRLFEKSSFDAQIVVPFCPESSLSGVNYKDFINAMWYQRTISVPASWKGRQVMLHFGGVDYKATIFVDGKQVFVHYGGSASFSVDITSYVTFGGSNNLIVYVQDDVRSGLQTIGKQSPRLNSYACFYTRVTGIWQTVWMEPISTMGLKSCRIIPDLDNRQFVFEPQFYPHTENCRLSITLKDGKRTVWHGETAASNNVCLTAQVAKVKTWSPESPFLYDVEYEVRNLEGKVTDRVKSYAGMRKSEIRGTTFYLNNQPYYQRLVLDQGYYPDGQWTAPTDERLKRDILLGKEAGFNGARLHQKVFEQRYLYWADKLGYLTWGESANWGLDYNNQAAARNMLSEWTECVERDYNEPCLVAWSPLNEVWVDDVDGQRSRLTNDLYFLTKRLDHTRPVLATSGGIHAGFTDIFSEHIYEQDPVELYRQLKPRPDGGVYIQHPRRSAPYKGEAYVIDEFGGIRWVQKMQAEEVAPEGQFWGYGNDPQTLEEYYQRLEQQVNVVLSLDHISGFCYTQLVDVELEKNGIYTYDRGRKFDMERIRRIFSKPREQAKQETARLLKQRNVKE